MHRLCRGRAGERRDNAQNSDGRQRTRHTLCFPRRQSGRLIARKHKEKRAPRISRRYYIPQAARPKSRAYVSRATAGRTSRSRLERRRQPMPNAVSCPPKGAAHRWGQRTASDQIDCTPSISDRSASPTIMRSCGWLARRTGAAAVLIRKAVMSSSFVVAVQSSGNRTVAPIRNFTEVSAIGKKIAAIAKPAPRSGTAATGVYVASRTDFSPLPREIVWCRGGLDPKPPDGID